MNEDIAWEVSNVYRTNVSRRRIYRKDKRVKKSLEEQANFICKDALSERYIHNAFGKFDNGYAYYERDDTELLAFCLWKVYKETGKHILDILLLCSKEPSYGLGKTMINDIEYYCFENKIDTIRVTPVTRELFKYYEKFGFKENVDEKTMTKHLSLQHTHMRRKNKTRKIPAEKRHFPMIASMMPVNMNVWKNNLI